MDVEEEMFEEHLDEEYQTSEFGEKFNQIETQIVELESKKLNSFYDQEQKDKLEKAITLLRLHVQNYQRIITLNRRRSRKRLRKRQCALRNFYLQSLVDMQLRYVEMLPMAIVPPVLKFYSKESIKEAKHECSAVGKLLPTDNNKPKYNTECETNEGSGNEDEEEMDQTLNFYQDIVLKFSKYQWLDTFHIPKHVFDLICSRLKSNANEIQMNFETWIAMCIYMFATGSNYNSVALLFNVEKKFVRQSLYKFIKLLLTEFQEHRPKMPTNRSELEEISEAFENASNMTPCVVGVLSLFEVPNTCACGRNNSCGAKSLKVQICIDNRLLFRKVETTDLKPTMFLRSPNEISLSWRKLGDDCILPYFLVAPPGYPLRTWLMQKYDNPRESWEYEFNKCFGSLNIFREVSLKRLFGRWHILSTTECIKPDAKSFIVQACCLLHNLLEKNKEYFSVEWCTNFNPTKYEYRLTSATTKFFNDSERAIEKRDIIAKLIRPRKQINEN
ncbi:uncharacterized protein ACRADG_001528 [Cochliomyia hominivorax]